MSSSPGAKMLKKAMTFKSELKDKIVNIRRNPSTLNNNSPGDGGGTKTLKKHSLQPAKLSVQVDRLEMGTAKVNQALCYAKDVVDKKTLCMLPGVATVVLETVQELLQTLHWYYDTVDSDEYTSACNDVYRATAELTRLADTVVLGNVEVDGKHVQEMINTVRNNVQALTNQCVVKADGPSSTPSSNRSSQSATMDTSQLNSSLNISDDAVNTSSTDDSLDASPPSKPPLPDDYEIHLCNSVPPMLREDSPLPPPLPEKHGTRLSTVSSSGDTAPSHTTPLTNTTPHSLSDNSLPSPRHSSLDPTDLYHHNNNMVVSPSWPGSRNSREPSPLDILEQMRAEMRTDIGHTLSSMRTFSHGEIVRSTNQISTVTSVTNQTSVNHMTSYQTANQIAPYRPVDQSFQSVVEHRSAYSSSDQMIGQAMTTFNQSSTPNMPSAKMTSSVQSYTFNERIVKSRDGIEQSQSQSASHVLTHGGKADVNASYVQSYLKDFAGKKDAYAFKVDVQGQDLSRDGGNQGKMAVRTTDLSEQMAIGVATEGYDHPPPLPLKKKHVDTYMLAFGQYMGAPSSLGEFTASQQRFQDFYRERFQQQQSEVLVPFDVHNSGDWVTYDNAPGVIEYPERLSLPAPTNDLPELPAKTRTVSVPNDNSTTAPLPGSKAHHDGANQNDNHQLVDERSHDLDDQQDTVLRMDVWKQIVTKEDDNMEFVKGGPVDALVALAASAGSREFMYQEAFLTTYLTFINAGDLIDKLLRRYSHFSNTDDVSKKRLSRSTFSMLIRVVDEMGALIGEEIIDDLFYLVFCLICDGELILAKCLRKTVLAKCELKQRMLEARHNIALLPSIQLTMRTTTLLDFKAHVLAEQMTLIDNELFQNIEISELLRYSREQREELSPNLTQFTEHFNKMSYWCRSRIMEKDESREREKFMNKFHKIMKHLRKLKNFHSYLALLSAVDSAPVRRLDWSKQTQDNLSELSEIIDSSSSFRKYRCTLADTQPPCIPYIGLILQDLTFVHIGNPDNLESGGVNFSKRWQMFHILEGLRRYKKQCYDIKKDTNVIMFFNGFGDYLSEEALWQLSEDYKPRKTSTKT